jgi:hypothetical protein
LRRLSCQTLSITSRPVRSWLLISLRSASQIQFACVAAEPSVIARCLPPKLNTALATNRHAPKEGQARPASAPTQPDRTASGSQSVVGASRRLNSQFWGAARGSAGVARRSRPELRSTLHSWAARLASSVVLGSAMPNYSIERTSQGLRPCAASHVRRWASRKVQDVLDATEPSFHAEMRAHPERASNARSVLRPLFLRNHEPYPRPWVASCAASRLCVEKGRSWSGRLTSSGRCSLSDLRCQPFLGVLHVRG